MRMFLLQHVDAETTTLVGVFVTIHAFKKLAAGAETKSMELLRILGPCVIIFGLLRFGIEGVPTTQWQSVATSDRIASADFPSAPASNDQTQSLLGQTVHTSGWICSVPLKDILLRLSFSEIPLEEAQIPQAERFNQIKQFFTNQGFEVLKEGAGDFGGASGFYLKMQQGEEKVYVETRMAFVGARIYRVIASSGVEDRADPDIRHFVNSFVVAGKEN